MVSITIAVPEDVRTVMKEHDEVNWSALVRKVIIEKVKMLSIKREMLRELRKEKDFDEWAVKIVREGRKNEGSGRY